MCLEGRALAIGADCDQVEGSFGVFGGDIILEGGFDANDRQVGQDRPFDGPFDRAARAFGKAERKAGGQRAVRGFAQIGQGDKGNAVAVGVGRTGFRDGIEVGRERLVIFAKAEARVVGQPVSRRQAIVTLDREIGTGCAKEIAGGDGDFGTVRHFHRAFGQVQREVDTLGQEIFDEKRFGCEDRAVLLGKGFDPPCAARGAAVDGHGNGTSACACVFRQRAIILNAVRADQTHSQRQAFDGGHVRVAGEDRRIQRFASAVGAAVGGEEHVDCRCRLTSGHATVRQVELGIGEGQERVILALFDGDHSRGRAARARDHRGREVGIALIVCVDGAYDRVGARDKGSLDANLGGGIRQGADKDVQAIGAAHGCKAEIGDDKPLHSGRRHIRVRARDRGLQGVDSGAEILEHIVHRQARRHIAVGFRLGDIGAAFPDLLGILGVEIVSRVIVERAGEIVLHHRADEVAVGDALKLQVEFGGIDGLDRDAGFGGAWQDVGAAGEADGGGAVADIGLNGDVLGERFTGGRRQTLAEGDRIAFAMLDPVDADLVRGAFDGEALVGELHEGAVVLARGDEVFVEVCADARVGGVTFDGVVLNSEAVFADGIVEHRVDVVAGLQ